MPNVVALIPVNFDFGPLGLPATVLRTVAGRSVLEHTLARLARVPGLDALVLVHPASQQAPPLPANLGKPVRCFKFDPGKPDLDAAARRSARLWSLTSWRGGLGGMTIYDELLPAGPLYAALTDAGAASAVLAGPDWMLIDPELTGRVLDLHRQQAQAVPMTFCQAPPGLAGLAIGADLLKQMAEARATFGRMLGYHPTKPQPDPIGRDVCIQIPGPVRSCMQRLIFDTPRAQSLISAVAAHLGPALPTADASTLVAAVTQIVAQRPQGFASLPPQITLELTPRRTSTGPVTPQHYLSLDRPDMAPELAQDLLKQIAKEPDVVVSFAGLGDPLLHPQWRDILRAAVAAKPLGLHVATDLLGSEADMDALLELPVDLITVNLNADTAEVYRQAMGHDGFAQVIRNLERLVNQRNARSARIEKDPAAAQTNLFARPWIVPQMVKTAVTFPDMEIFFDKWLYFTGHAVIAPAPTGCGLMPDLGPVNMAPARRFACRQLERRLTVLSNGQVALCDQDWLGRAVVGDARAFTLAELWQSQAQTLAQHRAGQWDQLDLCRSCDQWHRP